MGLVDSVQRTSFTKYVEASKDVSVREIGKYPGRLSGLRQTVDTKKAQARKAAWGLVYDAAFAISSRRG